MICVINGAQEEQAQLRESMSRSWGTAGASPVSRGGALAMSSWCALYPARSHTQAQPVHGSKTGRQAP